MDFTIGFTRPTRKHVSIMVVVDMLKNVAHFIHVNTTYSASNVAKVFIRYVVRLHGVPKKIVSDGDEKFNCKFWKDLFKGLGTKLAFNTT